MQMYVRQVCVADLVSELAQAAVPAHVCCSACQLWWPSAGLVLPAQRRTKGMLEADWRPKGVEEGRICGQAGLEREAERRQDH